MENKTLTEQEVFKKVLEDLGFADYKPSEMTNSDYWMCTCKAMQEFSAQQNKSLTDKVAEKEREIIFHSNHANELLSSLSIQKELVEEKDKEIKHLDAVVYRLEGELNDRQVTYLDSIERAESTIESQAKEIEGLRAELKLSEGAHDVTVEQLVETQQERNKWKDLCEEAFIEFKSAEWESPLQQKFLEIFKPETTEALSTPTTEPKEVKDGKLKCNCQYNLEFCNCK